MSIGLDTGLLVQGKVGLDCDPDPFIEALDACYAGLAAAQARTGFHMVWYDPESGKHDSIGYSSTRDFHDTPYRNRVIRILNKLLGLTGESPKYMLVGGCNWRHDLSDSAELLVRVRDKKRDAVLITTVGEFSLILRAKGSDAMFNPKEINRRKDLGIRFSAWDLSVGVVSSDTHAIAEFRAEFGDSVGDHSLWDDVIESYALYILDYTDVVLDEDRARQFLVSPHASDISLASRLTTAGALALSTCKCGLNLKGITSLTTNAALALAGHHGDLHLDGLTMINDHAAAALAQHHGDWLSLDGLTAIPETIAASLACHQGSWLSLNGLKQLSAGSARSLAKFRGGLSLNGLDTLTDDVAAALAGHQGGFIHLDGITQLTRATAAALAKHEHVLHLKGLTTLDESCAERLAKHRDDLHLDGLSGISTACAATLGKHKGAWLSLNGVTELSDEAAEALASHRGRLDLNGLISLSSAAAEALANNSERLDLNGLRCLSDGAARALAEHRGLHLHLNGLTELSENGAKALAGYQGAELFLGQLKNLPHHSAACLVRNSNIYLSSEIEFRADQHASGVNPTSA